MKPKLLARIKSKIGRECTVAQAKVACLVTLRGQPWFITTNKRGAGSVSEWTHHAEELAVKRVRAYSRALNIPPYQVTFCVMRFRYDGTLAMAKPCAKCARLLVGYTVSYTDDLGLFH